MPWKNRLKYYGKYYGKLNETLFSSCPVPTQYFNNLLILTNNN